MDQATLVLLGIYHGQANPERIIISDIDKLIEMSKDFEDRHGDTDWEDSDTDWADAAALWYNDTRDANWKAIPLVDDDPYARIKAEMRRYLFNPEKEYDNIVGRLKTALKSKKKRENFIDEIPFILVRRGVQNKFTIREFCLLIGLTHN